jgi:hypothetical protein
VSGESCVKSRRRAWEGQPRIIVDSEFLRPDALGLSGLLQFAIGFACQELEFGFRDVPFDIRDRQSPSDAAVVIERREVSSVQAFVTNCLHSLAHSQKFIHLLLGDSQIFRRISV